MKGICLANIYSDEYKDLAAFTGANKEEYAFRHYCYWASRCIGQGSIEMARQKWEYILELLMIGDYEWVWFTGADTLITNMTIDIHSVVEGVELDYATRDHSKRDLIITTDRNGINGDSFLIRGSVEGVRIVYWIIDNVHLYPFSLEYDQGMIKELLEKGDPRLAVVPQRTINSYDYGLYGGSDVDRLGTSGQWREGDLLIHWPATSLEHRWRLAREYSQKVIR